MNGPAVWSMVALGLAIVVVRRRSMAVALITSQALILVGIAITRADTANEVVAAVALAARAIALAVLFRLLVSRTRETRPVRAAVSPWLRGGLALAVGLALTWLIPTPSGSAHDPYQAVLALIGFGTVTAATRRATLFQVMGIVLVENALALAALTLGGGASLGIELGVTLDLSLVAVVAGVFHERIFAEFGAGDTAALRSLRD